ncbi:AzlD domain-containing protein [Streptomyces griseorubiginosus]|uniref:AzlD domain-containing protein n=1 Tax=Streptomyces griseorubiginosus TaxID=67304 RepID=UPI0036918CA4
MIVTPAVGTYAFRLVGPAPHERGEIPARGQEVRSAGAVVLLMAPLATGSLAEGGSFAGWARRGAGAAAGTAVLRAAGDG